MAQQTTKVADTNKQLDTAKTTQAQAAKDVNDAQAAKDTVQTAVDNLNTQINDTQDQIDNSKIILTDDYINAVKDGKPFEWYDNDEWYDISEKLHNYNVYHKVPGDNRVIQDISNMSQDDWADLATFTASLINSAREQLGYEIRNLVVTHDSINFAKNYAQIYQTHQYNDNSNRENSLRDAAVKSNVSQLQASYVSLRSKLEDVEEENTSWEYADDGVRITTTYKPITIGDLKKDIYNNIVEGLINKSSTVVLLGIGLYRDKGILGKYFSVAITDGNLELLDIAGGTANFDATPYDIPSLDTKDLQAKLTELKGQLPTLNANLKTATDNLTAKQTAKAAADKQVASLTADLKNNQDALAKLQAQKAVKDNGPKDLAAADQKVKDATAKYNEAKQAYDDAKSAYEAAQKQADTAKAAKTAADKKVADAQAKLAQAKDALAKAEQNLANMHKIYDLQQKFEDGHWRLYDGAGHRLTGFQRIEAEKKTVYYDKNGNMLYGQQNIAGKWYNFDKVTGAMSTGLTYLADQKKTVYYNDKGQMQYGQQNVDGKWYLFDKVTGAMKTGLQYIADQHKTVFYNNKGQMQYGQQNIGGHWYLFDKNTGAMQFGFQRIADQNKTVYYNKAGHMLYGQQNIGGK